MKIKDLKKKINSFFYLQWLRPENVAWDLHVSIIFQKYFSYYEKKNKDFKSLEIGVGNGFNTLLNLNGQLNEKYDFFLNTSCKNFFQNKDIYDSALKKNSIPKDLVKTYPSKKFDLALDLKKNLLKVTEHLKVSEKLISHDCNKEFGINERYDFIYSSIVYWLNNPKDAILRISKLLKNNGVFMFTIPNENYLKYCQSYSKHGNFWNLINRGRKDTLQTTIIQNEFEKWLKKNNFEIINNHKLLSEKTLKIWDFGLRPISPYLIRLTNSVSPKIRYEIKKNWCHDLYPIVENLVSHELEFGGQNGGYCIYLIKRKN